MQKKNQSYSDSSTYLFPSTTQKSTKKSTTSRLSRKILRNKIELSRFQNQTETEKIDNKKKTSRIVNQLKTDTVVKGMDREDLDISKKLNAIEIRQGNIDLHESILQIKSKHDNAYFSQKKKMKEIDDINYRLEMLVVKKTKLQKAEESLEQEINNWKKKVQKVEENILSSKMKHESINYMLKRIDNDQRVFKIKENQCNDKIENIKKYSSARLNQKLYFQKDYKQSKKAINSVLNKLKQQETSRATSMNKLQSLISRKKFIEHEKNKRYARNIEVTKAAVLESQIQSEVIFYK